jgi:hypothetical protein
MDCRIKSGNDDSDADDPSPWFSALPRRQRGARN